ncbi:hypothetical protein E7745_14325 [Duncaniella sp. C9]|uniref:hypothetical protein n=1 Tax=Muribaculaceae TaxID=2005473 RepID=UPI0010A32370|nr:MULTISPECIES: hypothetical protein [Muribaculaceae]MCX4333237.1 hypothetical protein [Paramuribaculum sp.]QCD40605.1 hypothetical protein E7745_14325 [Duncaniella sp. C9]QCP71710.1 hypothetical protein FDZ78_03565 [Duncaniella sp. B8]
MLTKIEMQYMDAVVQMNRRQRNHEIDWDERRFELTKAALQVALMMPWHFDKEGDPTPEKIAKRAVAIADAAVAELMTTESPNNNG